MTINQIQTLKRFFKISNAAFEFKNTLLAALGHHPHPTAMEHLHRMALLELEKEEPNAAFLDGLLFQMEQIAEHNKRESDEKRH